MARLKGKLELEGTLGDLSFYKTQDGIIVRQKWGPDKKRMKRDPAFAKALNHGKDFGQAAKLSSFLRGRLRGFLKDVYDNRVTGRMNKLMLELLKRDTAATPGARALDKVLADRNAYALLTGFEFNIHCQLREHLLKMPALKKQRGRFYLEGTLTSKDLKYPEGTTHAGLSIAWLSCDFSTGDTQLEQSEEMLLAKKTRSQVLRIATPKMTRLAGHSFFIVKLRFYKETIFGMQDAGKDSQAAALVMPG